MKDTIRVEFMVILLSLVEKHDLGYLRYKLSFVILYLLSVAKKIGC